MQGVTSFQEEATATWALPKSSSENPTARSIARAGARSGPSVTWVLRGRFDPPVMGMPSSTSSCGSLHGNNRCRRATSAGWGRLRCRNDGGPRVGERTGDRRRGYARARRVLVRRPGHIGRHRGGRRPLHRPRPDGGVPDPPAPARARVEVGEEPSPPGHRGRRRRGGDRDRPGPRRNAGRPFRGSSTAGGTPSSPTSKATSSVRSAGASPDACGGERRRPAEPRPQLVAPRGARPSRVRRGARPAARGRHDGRRRDPGRRVHGDVDRLVPDGARAGDRRRAAGTGHLRRRAERTERRLRRRVARQRGRPDRDLRRGRREGADRRRRAERRRDRGVVRIERRRRVVPQGRRPRRRDEPRAGRALALHDRGRRPAGARRRDRGALGRRGPSPVRRPLVRRRDVHPPRGHRAARAPRAGPPRRAARPRGPDPRGHAGDAVRGRDARDRRDPRRRRARGRGRDRAGRMGHLVAPVPPVPDDPRFVHGGDRAGAGAARRAQLDRRRGGPGSAGLDPLPAHDARRAHRDRPRRRPARARARRGPVLRVRRGLRAQGRRRPPRAVPVVRRRADRGRVGRPDQRLGTEPAVLRVRGRRGTSTMAWATRATASRRRTSAGRSSPRSPPTPTTSSPGCRSSGGRRSASRPSRSVRPGCSWRTRRSGTRTTRRPAAAPRTPSRALVATAPRRLGYNLGPRR